MVPFVNTHVLWRLLAHRSVAVVVTLWRRDHLIQEVSFDAYAIVRGTGAKLVVNDRLFAEFVTADLKGSLIESANAPVGLGCAARSNVAMVRVTQALPELKALFCRIPNDARSMDDKIHARYVDWFEQLPRPSIEVLVDADGPLRLKRDPLLISNLPAARPSSMLWSEANDVDDLSDAAAHDLQPFLFDANVGEQGILSSLQEMIASNPLVGYLMARIPAHGLYCGAVKQLMQPKSSGVRKPHRRDVAALVQNLYGCIAEMFQNVLRGQKTAGQLSTEGPFR